MSGDKIREVPIAGGGAASPGSPAPKLPGTGVTGKKTTTLLPDSILREVEEKNTIEGLIRPSKEINSIIGLLLREGEKAGRITATVTALNDRLVGKILEIAEAHLGQPPARYCWIAFGSEGRKEQAFRTDQDNALVFSDPETEREEREIRKYFSTFNRFVGDALVRCGFPACPTKYMASNPEWCRSLGSWKKYFADRVYAPTPEAVLNSLIFFDLRPLCGDFTLAGSLGDSLKTILDGQMVFLGYIANIVVRTVPPDGFSGAFILEKSGELKDTLDIKTRAVMPLVDIVRLFSLEKRINKTGTLERIEVLREELRIMREYAEELEKSFEFVMRLRMSHHSELAETGNLPEDLVRTDCLSGEEKTALTDVFRLITRLQEVVRERYRPIMW